jgi:hypothetical protein
MAALSIFLGKSEETSFCSSQVVTLALPSHTAVQADGQVPAGDQAGQEGEAEGARRRQVAADFLMNCFGFLNCSDLIFRFALILLT